MKDRTLKLLSISLFITLFTASAYTWDNTTPIIIDHTCTNLSLIPEQWIKKAKTDLHIAYGHTSHGSQLITGMNGLVEFKGDMYSFNSSGIDGALELRDRPFSGASDLGNPDRTAWETSTRNYLKNYSEINVIIWSWCGQVSSASEADINTYLNLMNGLEKDYPSVMFVYMTGHLDGSGLEGNLNKRNEQIRNHCKANNKILYDFADIESYDPDDNYFLDKRANDNCDYDTDGDGSRDGNWAMEWQNANPGKWYDCTSAHSQPLNANLKAYASWWLWSTLAGWTGSGTVVDEQFTAPEMFELGQNYPNPFNSATVITYSLRESSGVVLAVYNIAGQLVKTLFKGERKRGSYSAVWNASDEKGNMVTSGFYLYKLRCGNNINISKKMLYLK